MKLIFILLFALYIPAACPKKGNSPNAEFQQLDLLKNRSKPARVPAAAVTDISKFLATGNDVNRFKTTQVVTVTGYVTLVKYGQPETCSCESTSEADLDYHIQMGATPNATDKQIMICEVTRYNRCNTYAALQALKGKKVTITGYLFFDKEHQDNSVNINPTGTDLWRATCWEIHPCFSVKAD